VLEAVLWTIDEFYRIETGNSEMYLYILTEQSFITAVQATNCTPILNTVHGLDCASQCVGNDFVGSN